MTKVTTNVGGWWLLLVGLIVGLLDQAFRSNHLKLTYQRALANRRAGDGTRTRQDQVKLSAAEVEVLIGKYQSGATLRSLASLFNVHRVTVASLLQRHNVKLRQPGLDPDQAAQACRLYLDGWSLARIGEKFWVSPGTVRRILLHAGVSTRDSHGRPQGPSDVR